jgi:hypothetical protein
MRVTLYDGTYSVAGATSSAALVMVCCIVVGS